MSDTINLKIPAKPDYLLTARLTVSSVASRMGFDVNDVEDIKTAVSEALLVIIHQQNTKVIDMSFVNEEDALQINVSGISGKAPEIDTNNEDDTLSRYLIEALADDSYFEKEGEKITAIILKKNLQR